MWNVFGDKLLMKRLSKCKNIDEYKNIMRFFYSQLTLLIKSLHYVKYKTVFCFIMLEFYHFIDKTEKIALINLFDNV